MQLLQAQVPNNTLERAVQVPLQADHPVPSSWDGRWVRYEAASGEAKIEACHLGQLLLLLVLEQQQVLLLVVHLLVCLRC
jgi:hypothetical protein